jgi:dTMP kinase
MLITFEGLDGCGKTTQARSARAHLERAGKRVHLVREPGGTQLGEAVRAHLLDPSLEMSSMAELMLFSAARAQLTSQVLRPSLDQGDVVLCDRFYDSTLAYQGGGRGMDLEWLESLCLRVTGGLAPRRTYLLRISPEQARVRRADRAEDRMEQTGAAFAARVAATYDALAARHPDRWCVLDAARPADELARIITTDLDALLRAATR